MNNKKISFIVPVYNVEQYLKQCIESIINQNIEPKEIILVNDGSTDNSKLICEEYSKKFKNIKVINKKNGGLSSARNEGIKNATGEYLFFVDSDDFLIGDYISSIYNECKKNDLDIIRCIYCRYNNEKGEIIEKNEKRKLYYDKVLSGIEFLKEEIKNNTYEVVAWLGLFKREYLMKNNIKFTENVTHEDHEFFLKCLLSEKNNNIMKKDLIIYGYRIREGSITKTPRIDNITDILKNIYSMKKFVNELNLREKEKAIAMKPISAIFYQLTSVYGRLSYEDKKIAYEMVPKDLKKEMIKYSFNKYQKIKIILFFDFKELLDLIYKIKQDYLLRKIKNSKL
ncbi:glycosyltransferase [Clostridium perfringens]|uniref:glycosyltransferase n=1 Tax=Clostridium perfringens TaxID=1502 RepID=UPI0018E42D03|nr:glycosyltransferase [Clostridium perfringens]MBI6069578.1 glycosyltransferase [Clostridium perfringens]MBI6097647.1 glycosyltransferase [Clostridium perfringens]MCF2687016.1 glycosyltransferase [Clostridium perfringens]